jgi:aminomethyltransferase
LRSRPSPRSTWQILKPGRQRYGLFTNDKGGLEDDFMVANRGDHLYLVVNAACKHDDLARIKAALSGSCEIEAQFDRGLIALQGPAAEGVLSSYAPKAEDMLFMDVTELEIGGVAGGGVALGLYRRGRLRDLDPG